MASTSTGNDTRLLVELPDGDHVLLPASSLERVDDQILCAYDRRTLEAFRLQEAVPEHLVLPIVREDLDVSKRTVEGDTFVVSTETRLEEAPIDVSLQRETVEVERVPIDRFVDEAPQVREDDGLTIVPVVEEVLVVTKRLKLREEIHIRRRVTTERETRTVELRRQEAHVERRPATSSVET